MALIYEDKIPNNKEAFIQKVKQVASNLGLNPNSLMAVMYKESGLKPWIQNTSHTFADGGHATGLIQFIPSTARGLGTSTQALKQMSNVQQMDYVQRYFEPFKAYFKHDSLLDEYLSLYLITFYPNADRKKGGTLTKPDNWRFPNSVYRANPSLDISKDGILTISDVKGHMLRGIPEDWRAKFASNTNTKILFGSLGLLVLLIFLYLIKTNS